MKINMYALRDSIAEDFSSPVLLKNDNLARRFFWRSVQSAQVKADEMRLYKLGVYDVETGEIDSNVELIPIADNGDDMNE